MLNQVVVTFFKCTILNILTPKNWTFKKSNKIGHKRFLSKHARISKFEQRIVRGCEALLSFFWRRKSVVAGSLPLGARWVAESLWSLLRKKTTVAECRGRARQGKKATAATFLTFRGRQLGIGIVSVVKWVPVNGVWIDQEKEVSSEFSHGLASSLTGHFTYGNADKVFFIEKGSFFHGLFK